jgi:hypothetical protein
VKQTKTPCREKLDKRHENFDLVQKDAMTRIQEDISEETEQVESAAVELEKDIEDGRRKALLHVAIVNSRVLTTFREACTDQLTNWRLLRSQPRNSYDCLLMSWAPFNPQLLKPSQIKQKFPLLQRKRPRNPAWGFPVIYLPQWLPLIQSHERRTTHISWPTNQ